MRKLFFVRSANEQFRAFLSADERAVATEQLLRIAEDPDLRGSMAVVGQGTAIRRARIAGLHFFLLPTEVTDNLPQPMLIIMKVRSARRP